MVKNKRNKKAAMEMTVGTIVTIVLLMSALVLGLVLTKTIFVNTTNSVNSIDEQMKSEINDLFEQDESKDLIVGLGGESTAKIKQGTDQFGIPFAFSPERPQVWGGENKGCLWSITTRTSASTSACTNPQNKWTNPTANIFPGIKDMQFDEVYSNNGYSLLKIDVPEDVSPCTQRFYITVTCAKGTSNEQVVTGYFDIKVLKRGL
ncbi:MAG: hypothetical protein ACP5NZ_05095 [Nanobdellota archaeon]